MKRLLLTPIVCLSVVLVRGYATAGEWQVAVQQGDLQRVQDLLAYGIDINASDDHGRTALHLAVLQKAKPLMELLLHNGAQVNVHDKDGNTPLHLAAESGEVDFVTLLLTHRADVHARNSQHWTTVFSVEEDGNLEIVNLLNPIEPQAELSEYRGETPLHRAAYSGSEAVVRLLLTHHAEANAKNEYNQQTPLHLAVGQGNPEVVTMLLAYGAEVNALVACSLTLPAKKRYLLTPLHLAALAGHATVTELLLQHQADVNRPVQAEAIAPTASMKVATGRYYRLEELEDLTALTPLHFAVFMGEAEVATLLIKYGADPNAQDLFGKAGNILCE